MTFDPRHQPTSAARNIGVPTTIGGGFVPATPVGPSYTSLCGPKGSYANLSATVVTTGDPTHVSLSVQTFPAEYGGPCATQSGGPLPPTSLPQVPAPYAQLPRLQLPAGSEIIGYSGNGGSQYSASNAVTIQKAPAISELDQLFSGQLQAAGWTRSSGATDPSLAVNLWRKTANGTDLQAVLSVVRAIGGDDRVDLSIVVTTPASNNPISRYGGPYGIPSPVATIAVSSASVSAGGPPPNAAAVPTATVPTGFAPAGTRVAPTTLLPTKRVKAKPKSKK